MISSNIRPKKYWSRKTTKTTTYNAFYASKLQDYVEGLLFLEYTNTYKSHMLTQITYFQP